jgi:hypothetical protein
MGIPTLFKDDGFGVGIVAGIAYGLFARFVVSTEAFGAGFVAMTWAFLLLVPMTIGYLTVRRAKEPSLAFRIFAPWASCFVTIALTVAIGWEGSICVVMGTPLILLMASVGGALGASSAGRERYAAPILLALPYLVGPLEAKRALPRRFTESVAQIDIAAPAGVVWPLIASVDSIRPEERHPALFTRLGFPEPISATLSRPGVGGIRRARFEGGIVFTETVTDWVPDSLLSFTIKPNTDSIPPTTLDPHVTIGGPFFDVLTGTYELQSLDAGHTRLVLRSRHRVSTPFNPYAGWWADRIMRSIQDNILAVHKARAERA